MYPPQHPGPPPQHPGAPPVPPHMQGHYPQKGSSSNNCCCICLCLVLTPLFCCVFIVVIAIIAAISGAAAPGTGGDSTPLDVCNPLGRICEPSACLENGGFDNDCCAMPGTGSCQEGFTWAFNQEHNGCASIANNYGSCCTPDEIV